MDTRKENGAFQEKYGSFFIRVLRDGRLRRFDFYYGYAGAPRITPRRSLARCLHGDAKANTDDAGDNTDDTGDNVDDP